MFVLFNLFSALFDSFLDISLGTGEFGAGPIYIIYCLAVFLPSLAVLVRRVQDIGKSRWFFFISLIPVVGPIWLLVVLCKDSDPGTNEYGPNPKMEQTPVSVQDSQILNCGCHWIKI